MALSKIIFLFFFLSLNSAIAAIEDKILFLEQSLDISTVPNEVYIWNKEFGGHDGTSAYGRASILCLSSTSAVNGLCPTRPQTGYGEGSILLNFTESKSGRVIALNLKGYSQEYYIGCGVTSYKYVPWTGVWLLCNGAYSSERVYTYYIPKTELLKLSGGKWKAELRMTFGIGNQDSGQPTSKWNASIVLNVTDKNNMQIYLPQFPIAAPHVDLNLRPLPGSTANRTTMEGSSSIDICMYDGFGSNSSRIKLLLRDEGKNTTNRMPGRFSLYHEGGAQDESSRVDYSIAISDLKVGSQTLLSNGNEIVWSAPDLNVRSFMLPGMLQPVLCYPSTLHLRTPSFAIADKKSGRYTGKLTLIFTPET